jgi:hypothetical protein
MHFEAHRPFFDHLFYGPLSARELGACRFELDENDRIFGELHPVDGRAQESEILRIIGV